LTPHLLRRPLNIDRRPLNILHPLSMVIVPHRITQDSEPNPSSISRRLTPIFRVAENVDVFVHETFVSPARVFFLSALTEEFEAEGVGDAETGEDVGYREVLLGGGDVDVLGFCAVGPGYEFLGGVVVFFPLVLVEFTVLLERKAGGVVRCDLFPFLEVFGGEF
jgi:hypothetical protein